MCQIDKLVSPGPGPCWWPLVAMTMPYYNHLVFVGVEEKGGVPSLYDLCLVNWLNCVKKLLIEGKSILALKQQLDDVCVGHVRRDIHQYVFQHKSRQTRGKQVC